jgi:hypothetical protein
MEFNNLFWMREFLTIFMDFWLVDFLEENGIYPGLLVLAWSPVPDFEKYYES